MEACVGGAQKMADLTGSKAYERFTGNQILKIYQTQPQQFKDTEVSLVGYSLHLASAQFSLFTYADGLTGVECDCPVSSPFPENISCKQLLCFPSDRKVCTY